MWQWLEHHRYWIFYYVVYLVVVVALAILDWPSADVSKWADVFAVAAGIGFGTAAIFEIGVRTVLLIQPTIKKIRVEERSKGVRQVLGVLTPDQQRTTLDLLEDTNKITSDQRSEIERELAQGKS